MAGWLNRLIRWLGTAELALGGALLILMIAINFAEMVSRKFFSYSLLWVQDATLLFACWSIFLGAAYLYHQKEMIMVELVVNRLPPRAKAAVAFLTDALILYFLYYLIRYGIRLQQLQSATRSYALHVPSNLYSLPLLICGGLIGLTIVRDILVRLVGKGAEAGGTSPSEAQPAQESAGANPGGRMP